MNKLVWFSIPLNILWTISLLIFHEQMIGRGWDIISGVVIGLNIVLICYAIPAVITLWKKLSE